MTQPEADAIIEWKRNTEKILVSLHNDIKALQNTAITLMGHHRKSMDRIDALEAKAAFLEATRTQ